MATLNANALGGSRRLLLDSAVWIAVTMNVPDVVSPELLLILEQAAHENRVCVSTATVWELALLARRGDIDFIDFPQWIADQKRPPGVSILPITEDLVYRSTLLNAWGSAPPGNGAQRHGDAAPTAHQLLSSEAIDRFLIATAQQLDAVVVTTDPAMLAHASNGLLNAYDARG